MGHIIAVYSGSGGSGCTTLAVNLAIGLMQQNARVLLIDLNLPYGDVGLFLNLRPTNALLDALDDDLDVELLLDLATRHETGLSVLPTPPTLAEAQQITAESVKSLLRRVTEYYDFVVIDLPHQVNELTLTVLDAASVIVLMLLPTLTGVKNARLAYDRFTELGHGSQTVIPVLNRVSDVYVKQRIAIDSTRIEKHLKLTLVAQLPLDETAAGNALTKGMTLILHSLNRETAPLSQALIDFSNDVFRRLVWSTDDSPAKASSVWQAVIQRRLLRKPLLPPQPLYEASTSGETVTVLIVDDHAEAAKHIQILLGFEPDFDVVGIASTGEVAIEMAKRFLPFVILLDVNLTDMDSIEAASQIAKSVSSTAIIMMSIANSPEMMRRALTAGAQDFLTKPIVMDELYTAVRNARLQKRRYQIQHD